jgi:GR25 family glycosyltransferase involved in LPS biosynthesis
MKAFVIYLKDRPHSVDHATAMIDTLADFGLDAELSEGTPGDVAVNYVAKDHRVLYPYSIKGQVLSENQVQEFIRPELWNEFHLQHQYKISQRQEVGASAQKMSRPGVIGCFYSHYHLWQQCAELDEPVLIFEDDVKFFRGWAPVEWEDILIVSLGKTAYLNDPYKTYLETPVGSAQPMTWRNFSMPGTSGYAIQPMAARKLIKFYKNYFCPSDNAINQQVCTIQIHNYLMGRHTLPEEGNQSMTKTKDWQ